MCGAGRGLVELGHYLEVSARCEQELTKSYRPRGGAK